MFLAENDMSTPDILHFVIDEAYHNERLDKVLGSLQQDLSRTRIKALIDEKQVVLNNAVCAVPSKKVKTGDRIDLRIPPVEAWYLEPENIPLDIVYEDEHLLVINKPPGLVVHPGPGHRSGTLVHALLYHCGDSLSGIGGVERPGIIHRLDKDTSGLMLVAKTDRAHKALSKQLSDRTLKRQYKALVLGVPVPLKGTIDAPIGRHPKLRQKMAVNRRNGKSARTHYQVLERFGEACALVLCSLESGRTHQIRVHMNMLKHPIIGDPLYGPQITALTGVLQKEGFSEEDVSFVCGFGRQALHACRISFNHPVLQETLSFESEISSDFFNVLNIMENKK